MDDIRQYFTRMAPAFDSYYREPEHGLFSRLAHEVFRKPGLVRRFKTSMDLLKPARGKRILDVGCGSGPFAIYLWREGAQVTGIDLAPAMIEAARQNAEAAGWKDPDLRVGDAMDLRTETPYDATIAIGVFDYLGRSIRDRFLAHICGLTKGPVIATFPKLFTPQSPIRRLYFVGKETAVYFYTAAEVRRLAAAVNRTARFLNCGPIWTIAFDPRPAA